MWQEVLVRELAVFINISVEATGLNYLLSSKPILPTLDPILTSLQFKKEDETSIELVTRIMNLLSKLSKEAKGASDLASSKNIMLRVILYFNRSAFPHDLVMHSLRLLHNCCKSVPDFRTLCLDTHGFSIKHFDTIITDSRTFLTESIEKQDWELFVNACHLISAISDVLPER
jgi:hypothetical protein